MSEVKGAAMELGTERIRKLLMQYAVPAIIAMTASSLYNMVDSIFIGHGVGPLAISGLALTFPLMNLAAAFGSLVGVGAATLVSMRLGQRDYGTAQNILGNVVVLNLIISVSGALSAFEMPYVVTGGGFNTSTYFVVMDKIAHTDQKVGLASAMAVVLLLLIVIVTYAQKAVEKWLENRSSGVTK